MKNKGLEALNALYAELHKDMHHWGQYINWDKGIQKQIGEIFKPAHLINVKGYLDLPEVQAYLAGKVNAITHIRGKIYAIIRDLKRGENEG
jgi:hypothetical protein